MNILVLGLGNVGIEIYTELSRKGHNVIAVDTHGGVSSFGVIYQEDIADFFDKRLNLIKQQDLIINALPGSISYKVLELFIPLGIDIVDISFMEEDARQLDELANTYNTRVIYDCGIAPGLCNIILGYHLSKKSIREYDCIVGGVPKNPIAPYYHKTLFSIRDLLSEYTRPARCKRNGELVVLNPLERTPSINWPELGTMEVFPSDGLRSLLDLDIPQMVEMTARHKGHLDAMRFIKDAGFLDEKHIDTTIQILSEKWQMESDEEDLLRMDILITPFKGSIISYNIYDEYRDGVTAMARTTAYSCIAIAQAFYKAGQEGSSYYGVFSPEKFIMTSTCTDKVFKDIIKYLVDQGIKIEKRQ